VREPTREAFKAFQELLVNSRAIAVAATFPAFLEPNRFPMVDIRVASWVLENLEDHNKTVPEDCQLSPPKWPGNGATVLTLSDFGFMQSWINWCRHTAEKLPPLGNGEPWRARDVEMAVFQASRDKRRLLPLPPLEDG
jgi:hypothetical protein